jgi:hypothetical protein
MSLGGTTFSKEELRAIMNAPISGLASLKLAQRLITAKLNAANGVPQTGESSAAVAAADALLAESYIEPTNTALGKEMLAAASALATYNSGDVDGCVLFNPGPADPQPKFRELPPEFGGPGDEPEPEGPELVQPELCTARRL